MARKKLKEQEASGEDMPYYGLVGAPAELSTTETDGDVKPTPAQVAAEA